MQISTLGLKIIGALNVSVYYNDMKTFASVTYLKQNTDIKIERSLYLANGNSLEALEFCKLKIRYGFERMKEMICTKCDFDEDRI